MKKKTILILGMCIILSLIIIVIAEDSLTSYDYTTKLCDSSKSLTEYKECMRLCVSKEPVYVTENYTIQKPVYKNETQEICCTSKEFCGDCKSLKNVENNSCSFGCKDVDIKVIDYYINETYEKEAFIGYECRTGIIIDDKIIINPNINVNVEEGYIYECSIPLGDRNWKEFPMRQYEIDKGMCKKTYIIQLVTLK